MRGQMYCLNCEPTESDGTPTGQPVSYYTRDYTGT